MSRSAEVETRGHHHAGAHGPLIPPIMVFRRADVEYVIPDYVGGTEHDISIDICIDNNDIIGIGCYLMKKGKERRMLR
jgi:hypothetical protein